MSVESLYFENDNLLLLSGLKDEAAGGDYQNAATVTAQIKTLAGAPVGSIITLNYVVGSDGDYEGGVPNDIPVAINTEYAVEVTALSGGLKGFWNVPLRVIRRTTE